MKTELEDRRIANLVVDPDEFVRTNKGKPAHEGWSNSATWCFNLYLTQSQYWMDELRQLVRRDGKVNLSRVVRLFLRAQMATLDSCAVDDWCEGNINVREVVEDFFEQYSGGIEFKGFA